MKRWITFFYRKYDIKIKKILFCKYYIILNLKNVGTDS